tara:strand:+ start:474 stop:650 length:177 start_codon:yes stop_codon:yes gene_type:complete
MDIRNTVYSLFIWMMILSTLVIMCYQLIKRFCPRLLIFEEVEEEIQMENIAGEEVIIR